MTENALALRGNNQIIRTMDDAERAAKAMSTSGYFKDSATAAQAVVKILAGQEMGFGPFASMNGVYIIQGRPSIGANLMAAAVKKSGRYNYRVIEMTNDVCEIAFFEGKEEIGRSKFTKEDAAKAGTQNMGKFPRNMLFARAMSNGVKWYCPDVFNGSTVYTPEELGATVNEDGDIIDVPVAITPAPETVKVETPAAPANGNGIPHAEGTVLPVQRPSASMLKKWGEVAAEAAAWGIEVEAIEPDKISAAALAERGKALRVLIEKAERDDEAARAAENE